MSSGDLVAAKMGRGLNLDGDNDGVVTSINLAEIPNANQYTLSIWMKAMGSTGTTTVMAYSVTWGGSYAGVGHGLTSETTGDPFLLHVADNDAYASVEGTLPVEDGEWHQLVGTRDGDTFTLYRDGELAGSEVVPGIGQTTNTSMWIGLNPYGLGIQEFLGVLDEARVSATAHTQAWIETEYRNQSSPDTFMTFSSAETL